MQIHIVIDDHLYRQAVNLSGLADKQALLEEALRQLIQARKKLRKTGAASESARRKALEHLASVRIAWSGKPISDRNALYDDARG
ncbi:MAG: type II toxin-antitoxin system VapB family antitoxin [Gammaproteobacteria bacterium]|nr:type II toxin-antitoxin system VapB family antitoxin [Gammaproteobacteria bacterium]